MKDRLGLLIEGMKRDVRYKRGEMRTLEGQIQTIIFYIEQMEQLLNEEQGGV